MECQQSDSNKLHKVFDAAKRKRNRRRKGIEETRSVTTDDSVSQACQGALHGGSGKASLQDVRAHDSDHQNNIAKRERDSSVDVSPLDRDVRKTSSRSPRRYRRHGRDNVSLALKAGMVSTPRSMSPHHDASETMDAIPQDQDSFIYAFLEEAIKKDKRKRHARKHEEKARTRETETSPLREPRQDRHHRKHRDNLPTKDQDGQLPKQESYAPTIDQNLILETFSKLCTQLNKGAATEPADKSVTRSLSHKSLQCEVQPKRNSFEEEKDEKPVRMRSYEQSPDRLPPSRIRSHDNFDDKRSRDDIPPIMLSPDRYELRDNYEKELQRNYNKFSSKLDISRSRMCQAEEVRSRSQLHSAVPVRSCIDNRCSKSRLLRDYRTYDDRRERYYEPRKQYDDEKRRHYDHKASKSFDVSRDPIFEEKARRTSRSDRERCYDERDLRDLRDYRDSRERYYDDKNAERDRGYHSMSFKDRRAKRNFDRLERMSVISRDESLRERDRDSGLSVADGASTVSGKSTYLRVVKQEIAEQREAMDKMMKLWKDLMRCFKDLSQSQGHDKAMNETAERGRESAAAQLRLWQECMRRYETVARDVGDTDQRLMEEINKQRSEMAEMSGMWQECLQRYRDISNDFNTLKQKLVTSESPSRVCAAAPPVSCPDGEGLPPAPYRMQNYLTPTNNYPLPMPPMPGFGPGGGAGGRPTGGSPMRGRGAVPPPWWWAEERSPRSPRRRSSPDSRSSRDREQPHRDRRHAHKDREDTRYKEKSAKPNATRSEHRRRKR